MQEEINIINHLLSVEKNASVLIDNAVREADYRTSQSRNQANSQFKTRYDECVSKMEAEYEQKINSIKAAHEKDFEQFKSDLESREQNFKSFNSLLDNLLHG